MRSNSSSAQLKKKNIDPNRYVPIPLTRSSGIRGVKLDFNDGARLKVPKGNYHVRFTDLDAMAIVFDTDLSGSTAVTNRKYYINFRVELWKDGELILSHDLDLKGKNVHIVFPVGTLGDIIAWFPHAAEFGKKHSCNLYCSMQKELGELFAPAYPDIRFIESGDKVPACYATYRMGLFPLSENYAHQPVDHRVVGLWQCIPPILGLDTVERRPVIKHSKRRKIKEPYVCIATKSTGYAKYWNNPKGWDEVTAHLIKLGYRVLCIDRETSLDVGGRTVAVPKGAEDFTGNLPLQQRVDLLAHADFFVGLSSGLSWLAWAVGIPVVMISGFTLPHTEFYTPYRVISYHVCNGCWNDIKIPYDLRDFYSCPRHHGSARAFECSRLIGSGQVCNVIDRLMEDYHLKKENK